MILDKKPVATKMDREVPQFKHAVQKITNYIFSSDTALENWAMKQSGHIVGSKQNGNGLN